jgi:hypothetical protein
MSLSNLSTRTFIAGLDFVAIQPGFLSAYRVSTAAAITALTCGAAEQDFAVDGGNVWWPAAPAGG